jgi:hypothetical protein
MLCVISYSWSFLLHFQFTVTFTVTILSEWQVPFRNLISLDNFLHLTPTDWTWLITSSPMIETEEPVSNIAGKSLPKIFTLMNGLTLLADKAE